jgi:hypothetical protein
VAAGEQPQSLPKQQLIWDLPAAAALRGAMLPCRPACSSFRYPETALQVPDRPAPPLRAHQFPRATSRSMSLSSSFSASNRFNLAFSFSNCFKRTTSSGRIALYCDRQRW